MPKYDLNLAGLPQNWQDPLTSLPPVGAGFVLPFAIRYRISSGLLPRNTLLVISEDGKATFFESRQPPLPPPLAIKVAQLSKESILKLKELLQTFPPNQLQDTYGQYTPDILTRQVMFLSNRYDKVVRILGLMPMSGAPDAEYLINLLKFFGEVVDTYFKE